MSSTNSSAKNQAITTPVDLDSKTGEVLVKKSTGKVKIRKGQSEGDYNRQLDHYFNIEKGPSITEENSMDNNELGDVSELSVDCDLTIKQTRQKLIGFCERFYYKRQYQQCLDLTQMLLTECAKLNKKGKIKKEIQELEHLVKQCSVKVEQPISSDSITEDDQ